MFNEELNIVIIEDEKPAQRRLIGFIKDLLPNSNIKTILSSVQESILWFKNHTQPDLIFQDIELEDGNSFLIFEKVDIHCPIIFTTAYNEFAIKAFEVNSIDYLLKPYTKASIVESLKKMRAFSRGNYSINDLKQLLEQSQKGFFKETFMVKSGQKILKVGVDQVAFFKSEEKITWLVTMQENKYVYDTSLELLEGQIDSSLFFRVSRKYLISKSIVDGFKSASSHRVEVLSSSCNEQILVSKERVKNFKSWLEGEFK